MSCIHFIGGEKGGVGKSVLARLLSQYFIDRHMPYQGLDADQSHASLTRYYPQFSRPLKVDRFESSDQIIELALEEDRQVLVDLPAQSQRFLDHWVEDNDVLTLCEEMELPVVFWYVVDDGRDSVQLLNDFLSKYQHRLSCVVVKNRGRGSDFSELESLPALMTEDAPQQAELPALHSATLHRIDKLDFSFWAATAVRDGSPKLTLMERQRTRVWLKRAYTKFDAVMASLPMPKPELLDSEETTLSDPPAEAELI